MDAQVACALNHIDPRGGVVLKNAARAWLQRQLTCREEVGTVDLAVDYPAVLHAVSTGAGNINRLQIVVLLEGRVNVCFPIHQTNQVIEIVGVFSRHILDEQFAADWTIFNDVLEHCQHVRRPLHLIGAE